MLHTILLCVYVFQISKDLVDVQIEANKMRERYEAEIFDLKNMVSAGHTHDQSPLFIRLFKLSALFPRFYLRREMSHLFRQSVTGSERKCGQHRPV